MPFKSVHLVVSDRRNEWYDKLRRELNVLSAEGIYEVLQREKLSIQDFGKLQLEFWVDDHVFWEKKKDDDQNQDENQNDNNEQNQNDQNDEQEQQRRQELEEKWRDISEKMQTNLETFSKEAGEEAGDLLQYLKVENRER